MTRPTLSRGHLTRAAPLFAALGDKTRLQIVGRLCNEGPLSLAQLTESASISRQALTKHLNALSRAGIITDEQSGRSRLWRLETERLREVRKYLDEIASQWDAAVVRLRAFVETDDH